MKIVAILVLLGLAALYVAAGIFSFVMSVFCFDSGTEFANWQCFVMINGIVIVPALISLIAGAVLIFRDQHWLAIGVAAIPAVLGGLLFLAMIFFGP